MKKIEHPKRLGAIVGIAAFAVVLGGVAAANLDTKETKRAQAAAAQAQQEQNQAVSGQVTQEQKKNEVQKPQDVTVPAEKQEAEKPGAVQQKPDAQGENVQASSQSDIGSDRALQIALKDAGLRASDVTVEKNRREKDDGRWEYDVEFYTASHEYSYEILASDGTIRGKDKERMDREDLQEKQEEKGKQKPSVDQPKDIGVNKAKSIALKHAGVGGEVHYTKAKLEKDDGVLVYEIEFFQGQMEYSYEILASNGKILDWEAEQEDD